MRLLLIYLSINICVPLSHGCALRQRDDCEISELADRMRLDKTRSNARFRSLQPMARISCERTTVIYKTEEAGREL